MGCESSLSPASHKSGALAGGCLLLQDPCMLIIVTCSKSGWRADSLSVCKSRMAWGMTQGRHPESGQSREGCTGGGSLEVDSAKV
eukprot:3785955-Rhodomonas_salina.1